jgi:hypothetical protein
MSVEGERPLRTPITGIPVRPRRERPCCRAAEQRDEVAPFQLIELHSVSPPARAELQHIELARISQELTATRPNFIVG